MEIKQKTVIEIEKAGKAYKLICDNDSPLGNLFDVLMEMKGWCVERMSKAHKEESESAEQMMKEEDNQEIEDFKQEEVTNGSDCKD